MNDLITTYENTYGSAAKVFLRTLGGDPDKIIQEIEEAWNEPDPFAGNPLFPSSTAEEDAHNAILRDIRQRYFSGITRDAALAICNALGDLGEFCICTSIPDLTYTSGTFMRDWNASNPGEKPIAINGAAYFSN